LRWLGVVRYKQFEVFSTNTFRKWRTFPENFEVFYVSWTSCKNSRRCWCLLPIRPNFGAAYSWPNCGNYGAMVLFSNWQRFYNSILFYTHHYHLSSLNFFVEHSHL
jgi:hypothetical protein